VVLFISARTHLIRTAVVNFDLEAGGRKVKMRVFYALQTVNRPVEFPH
jgi:hypothetical protein